MNETSTSFVESNAAMPPRFWWLKRLSIASVLLLILLAGAWKWWEHVAVAREARAIDALRARGEPVLPADFVVPEVTDQQNVVYYLKQATAAINGAADPPAATNMEYSYTPLPPEWFTVARIAVEGNQASLKYLREARQHTQVDWGLKFDTRPLATGALATGLNNQRRLANLLGDTALYEHFNGNDAEALERIQDLFHLADAVERQPFLVGHLVGIGIDALTMFRLQVIAPGLRIADDPHPAPPQTPPLTPAQRRQVQDVIKILLSRNRGDGFQQSMKGERMLQLDGLDWIAEHATLLRPMYRLESIHLLHANDSVIAARTQPTYSAAMNSIDTFSFGSSASGSATQQLAGLMWAGIRRSLETDFRLRAETQLTAVSLAARLYQVDHDGQWPPNLDALVPTYLDAVPIDPFSPGGKPLRYVLVNRGRRPIVYSVGDGGNDELTFTESLLTPAPQYGWSVKQIPQWRDISRFEPPPGATRPSQH